MSKYIPPECLEFIRTCTTLEVQWGYFVFGLVIGLVFFIVLRFVLFNILRKGGAD